MKDLEHDIKNKLLEKNKAIFSEAFKQANEQPVVLRYHFERNIILELGKAKTKQSKILFNYYTTKNCLTHLKIKTKSLMSTYILVRKTCWKNLEKKKRHQMVCIIYLI